MERLCCNTPYSSYPQNGKLFLLPGPGPVFCFTVQVYRFLVWLLSAVCCLRSGSGQIFRLLSGLHDSVYSIICICCCVCSCCLFLSSVLLVWSRPVLSLVCICVCSWSCVWLSGLVCSLIWCAVSHPFLSSGLALVLSSALLSVACIVICICCLLFVICPCICSCYLLLYLLFCHLVWLQPCILLLYLVWLQPCHLALSSAVVCSQLSAVCCLLLSVAVAVAVAVAVYSNICILLSGLVQLLLSHPALLSGSVSRFLYPGPVSGPVASDCHLTWSPSSVSSHKYLLNL